MQSVLAIQGFIFALVKSQSQPTSTNKLMYSANTLRHSSQRCIAHSLLSCGLLICGLKRHASTCVCVERHIHYTLLSVNLAVPEEMYTCTHLHTYEPMQTDPYLRHTLEGDVLKLPVSYQGKEWWTKSENITLV